MSPGEPVFFYDFNSPYAYLAAERVDEVLPVSVRWQPMFFAAVLRERGRTPWSMRPDSRIEGVADVERRACERGLPPVVWLDSWPVESHSVLPLRATVWADECGRGKELALSLFRTMFVAGRSLTDIETVADAARECGLDADELREAVQDQTIKDRLRAATDEALALGINGVPTVAAAGELFWGDDRLEDAARALAA
jgi:2-hydroxychromene-2-carboxylate isomerase